MQGTNVRIESFAGLDQLPRQERIDALRRRMEAISPTVAATKQIYTEVTSEADVLSVEPLLGGILPGGGLARKAVTLMDESPYLAIEVMAHVASQGGVVGVVGWPHLCFAQMIEYGDILSNIVVVPEPGIEPLSVVATLAEGLDLVFCYLPQMEVTPSRARPFLSKLRRGTAAVVLVGAELAAPAARIRSKILHFHGIGSGTGRIQTVEIEVTAHTKNFPMRCATVGIGKLLKAPSRPALAAV